MIDCDRLVRAQALTCQGQFAEAEIIYHEILSRQPDAVDALVGLGALAYQAGKVEQASALFARGLALRPNVAELHANLGETLRLLRHNERAMVHLRAALRIKEQLPDAWNSLGLLLHDLGQHSEAEAAYREATRWRPAFSAALINLGVNLEAQGRVDEALSALRTAVDREPNNPVALTNLAKVQVESNDLSLLDEAEALCRRALAISPHLVQAINNLGNVLRLQGRLDDAMVCYQQAVQLDPGRAKPRWNIGQLLLQRGFDQEAIRVFDTAQSLDPDRGTFHFNMGSVFAARQDHVMAARHFRLAVESAPKLADAHHGLGLALLEQGLLDAAECSLHDALAIAPRRPSALSALARIEAERGDIEASCRLARRALAVQPNHADAYCQLATNLGGRLDDADLREIERLLDQKYVPEESRALLCFALASVHDARGQHATACPLFDRANALQLAARRARGRSYDPDRYSQLIDRLIAFFTPGFFRVRKGWGDPDSRPVFIVGLPRTGSSLIEQILASHPQVYGAGEVTFLQEVYNELPELVGCAASDRLGAVASLNADLTKAAARSYLSRLESLAPSSSSRIVDKMLENVQLVGLIALILPSARVIVCRRDPRDVAVSCWQTAFASIPWANDAEHIARRIADHRRLLDHWRRIKTDRWFEIDYEDLVADLEGSSRRLVQFLELEWDPACLRFHTTRRVVRTASYLRVREPIYKRSVGRWKNYDKNLQPLWLALERHGVLESRTDA